jgi:hypothetical protein
MTERARDLDAVRSGTLYFLVVFAAGWVLGPIRELWLIPRAGKPLAFVAEAVVMTVVILLAAHRLTRRLPAPREWTTRAVMGLVAVTLLTIAEIVGAALVRGQSLRDYVSELGTVPGVIFLALVLLFGAMPLLVRQRR